MSFFPFFNVATRKCVIAYGNCTCGLLSISIENAAVESDYLSTYPDLDDVTYCFCIYKIGIMIRQSTLRILRGFHKFIHVELYRAYSITN